VAYTQRRSENRPQLQAEDVFLYPQGVRSEDFAGGKMYKPSSPCFYKILNRRLEHVDSTKNVHPEGLGAIRCSSLKHRRLPLGELRYQLSRRASSRDENIENIAGDL